jgi:hypothetical protein
MGVIDGAINMDGCLEPWELKPPGTEPQPEGMIGETDAVEGLYFGIGTTEFRSLGVTPFIVGVLPDENRVLRCFRWNGRNSVPGCPRGHPEATLRPPSGHLQAIW